MEENGLKSPPAWDLDGLLPSKIKPEETEKERIRQALGEIKNDLAKVREWKMKLIPRIRNEEFKQFVNDYEKLTIDFVKLNSFADLKFHSSNGDEEALSLIQRMNDLGSTIENKTLFIRIFIRKLSPQSVKRLAGVLGKESYWFENSIDYSYLGEKRESVISIKNANGVDALKSLYEILTNKFIFNVKINGEEKKIGRDQLDEYLRDPDPKVREDVYKEFFRVFSDHSQELMFIYNSIVNDWRKENIELRKFKSPISAKNAELDMPDKAVEVMLATAKKNDSVFQRYFYLKAKWLGMAKLRKYDIFAPIDKLAPVKKYSFDEALRIAIDTFDDFSPIFGRIARQIIEEKHLDAQIRPGKTTGGFCESPSPTTTSWILMNFTGKQEDVETLAHELGHAIHSFLAKDHSVFNYDVPSPIAETASTFAEMMVMERNLLKETNPEIRKQIMAHKIEHFYSTIGMQAFLARWEIEAHSLISKNGTIEEITARYLCLLKDHFKDSVDVSDEFKWGCIVIPHFYTDPFYVYSYAFELLVLSLIKKFKEEGEPFKKKYIKLLSYGGSAPPAKILKGMGINIESEKFWQSGFDIISQMIDEVEKM